MSRIVLTITAMMIATSLLFAGTSMTANAQSTDVTVAIGQVHTTSTVDSTGQGRGVLTGRQVSINQHNEAVIHLTARGHGNEESLDIDLIAHMTGDWMDPIAGIGVVRPFDRGATCRSRPVQYCDRSIAGTASGRTATITLIIPIEPSWFGVDHDALVVTGTLNERPVSTTVAIRRQ